MATKMKEAQEHILSAEKYLKTSLLKWKPDYDSAADEYSQAAQCYRIGRDLKSAKETHLKASTYYVKNKSFFHAAKAVENAIIVGKEITPSQELFNMAKESSNLYQQHGSGDSAANVLDKTAKIIEENSPELALQLFQDAADVSASESGQHQAAEYIGKASRILVKLCMYDQAVDSLRREISYHEERGGHGQVGRLTVAIVLVQLARGDYVAAEKSYKEWGNNCEAEEAIVIEQLLAAYDEEDHDAAKRALNSPFIKHMDVEYARLARTIPLPQETGTTIPRTIIREHAAPRYIPASQRSDGVGGCDEASSSQSNAADTNAASEPSWVQFTEDPVSAPAPKADEEDDLC